MHFYRPLRPVAAMTFDLDDTLYDNLPVIRRTTEESHSALQAYHPALNDFSVLQYQQVRDRLLAAEPDIYHDVSEWRRRAVEQSMLDVGLTSAQAVKGSRDVMAVFARWRSKIDIPEETHATLAALAQRIPLVAITNGNAEPHLCGLQQYFRFTLRAGPDGRAKPYQDMYQAAAGRLNLAPEHILHVGDDLITDVAGAIRCGMQACWINPHRANLMQSKDSRLLPTLEISQLASLTALI
ncbi:MAG TPA: 5-amino-6-(5-phospho-D-ribitylamino)uracil phosphatase YigB [Erwinia persicina]|uniref:5-amino-6-(5-phospho-D-ribitylamino)uracil phosphatase YigB n=1 Tax=Erwinia persicina TaxID=55211 RepID=A0A3S7S847_9GAMM|nr:5-amino-6-(5-phospho-D-ribitylamino)uracil phosphatase YigB [Erwinia persicina]AXU96863.1 flavin mononucleotide phosphatase [Erwinia persicina]MBC3948013.1 5-amino-6-(5-phospho-D-ribitylamino)uracil phosphatase YigB [Erwinia persicina]MBD8108424.1 5-amino-6-(5-phospho-D-ribitylamino)uracil phosphatase YigB [Erwinia persicina]MBD8169894.1 5-amino-6-(5-phospho-D-ribitylamino)uracil phosphatase YigB [Erwinia persicina]MBD8211504.1 5-amino-6-(5-phospho-D-ribitylamino)uracil phosphatase YigB [Er